MRRTPCAACGRACAYCEACLTMGRSRECGLLILGSPANVAPASTARGNVASFAAPTDGASGIAAQSAAQAYNGVPASAARGRGASFAAPTDGASGIAAQSAAQSAAQAHNAAPASAARGRAASFAAPAHGASGIAAQSAAQAHNAAPASAARYDAASFAAPAHGASGPITNSATQPPTGPPARGSAAAITPDLTHWGLSPAQTAAATAALAYINASETRSQARRRFLLWAVTGAGKTEMIFPLIESCLDRGGRALIATPRRDVVLELDPRIRKAFPDASVVTLYGGSEQRWEQGVITLATTHQLFRFREGFDLVIVDEIDAFPYHGDPMLHYAAENVRKPDGVHVLLSATPPAALRMEARLGRLAHVRVPVRFHRHPLPVPVLIRIPPVRKLLKQRSLPRRLALSLRRSIERGAQLFVFVQQIRDVEPLAAQLRHLFPSITIGGTSSQDHDRASKVMRFRAREIRLLVTTTILERGVTVPKSDVFILDADGKLFDDASLIQMAGRAGRSKDDPAGNVYFCGSARTRAQQSAVAQIRGMNRIAKRQGYLLDKERK
ncbi:DEAD/DEAH box helicase family protein [Paenibacillus rhizovicinus]|uniref:DEAD/DEAH box helicase family protein n=2 Tax=Paenibacillus rhizovicinus TaxID=2704463 RepID=A0A6C0P9R5_9BACL|nr:DEAD/DEAH box helicase family protein [Paenibacillus rhizovicinus]